MKTPNLIIGDSERFDTGPRIGQWAIQLLLAGCLPGIWELLIEPLLGWNELAGTPFGNVGTQIANFMGIAVLGCLIGFVIAMLFPGASSVGRKIWLIPVICFLLATTWDLFAFTLNWSFILKEYFFWQSPGIVEGPLLRDLITYPALSSITYSLGVVIRTDVHLIEREHR